MRTLPARVRKLAIYAAAAACLIMGLATVWTPLPTGVPLIALGVVLLATVSPTARRQVRRARAWSGWLDRNLARVEVRAGRPMGTMLKRTRPLARKLQARAAAGADAVRSAGIGRRRKGA